MIFPVAIFHEDGKSFGANVPDIPGCSSAGDTFDEVLQNVTEAIQGHLEILAEDGDFVPFPKNILDHKKNKEYNGALWGFVDIDISSYIGPAEKVSVTLPGALKHHIDLQVRAGYIKSRSTFLVEAAYEKIMRG